MTRSTFTAAYRRKVVRESKIATGNGETLTHYATRIKIPVGTLYSWRYYKNRKRNVDGKPISSKMLVINRPKVSGLKQKADNRIELIISLLRKVLFVVRVSSTIAIICSLAYGAYWLLRFHS